MSDKGEALRTRFELLCNTTNGEVDFASFVRENEVSDDEDLGDLIDLDGRLRNERRVRSPLARYLTAIPRLPDLRCALDAAVEVALRSMSESACPTEEAVQNLIDEYPSFAGAIKTAVALSDTLSSTLTLVDQVAERPSLQVPSDFGSRTTDGVARYELRELLGVGSQGTVYLAVDRVLSEPDRPAWVAVKVFAARDLDAPLSRMVTEEANKARRINHPNVVRVIDKGTVDDMEYIVHEYVDGGNLHSWTAARSGPPTPVEAVRLVVQISRGVQAAHSAGLAHCDLKPSNVLIDKAGTAKVADFGVARRLAQSDDPEQTRSESPVGNLAFQAPELYHRERGAIAPRADIYALGGLLMFLITGIPPNGSDIGEVRSFLENSGTDSDTERFGPLSLLDHDLQVICKRALAIFPEDRYASADAFANDLESWLRHEPVAWMKPPLWRRMSLLLRREPLPISLGVGLALVLVAGAILIIQMNASARQRELRAEIREKQQSLDTTRRLATAMLAEMDRRRNETQFTTAALPTLGVLEVFVGPQYLKDPALLAQIDEKREDIIERLISENESAGAGNDLEWLLARATLALIRTRQGEYDAAESLLRQDRPKWAAMLSPDDPWLQLLDMVLASIVVARLEGRAQANSLDEADIERLRSAESVLKREQEVFVGMRASSNLHRHILEYLETLYGKSMLNDPDRLLELMQRRDKVFY